LLARLVVRRLISVDEPILIALDDTVFRRWGSVHHASRNRWIVARLVVRLPFCSQPVCLHVLFQLWAGRGSAFPVGLAGQ